MSEFGRIPSNFFHLAIDTMIYIPKEDAVVCPLTNFDTNIFIP